MNRHLLFAAIAIAALCAACTPIHAARFDASSTACGQTGPLPAACGNIVFDGDSISAGIGSSPGQGLDEQFMRDGRFAARIANVAVSGRPVAECLRLFNANVAPLLIPRARSNLIVFHAGDNDVAMGRSAEQTYAAFTQYVADAHALDWKVIVSTELPRFGFAPDKQRILADYNRLLLANAAGADAVVDVASDPRMADPAARNDPALFNADRVHPRDTGYAILARMLAAAAQPLLPR